MEEYFIEVGDNHQTPSTATDVSLTGCPWSDTKINYRLLPLVTRVLDRVHDRGGSGRGFPPDLYREPGNGREHLHIPPFTEPRTRDPNAIPYHGR